MEAIIYRLDKNGLSEQAANIVLSHQRKAEATWKIPDAKNVQGERNYLFTQLHDSMRDIFSDELAALGFNTPSTCVVTHLHTLPRAYKFMPEILKMGDGRFYIAVQPDYNHGEFVPYDAQRLTDAEVDQVKKFEQNCPKEPIEVLPIQQCGVATPADFNPLRHVWEPAPESDVDMAVFVAKGRSLDLITRFEANRPRDHGRGRYRPVPVGVPELVPDTIKPTIEAMPYIQSMFDRKLLVYVYRQGEAWNFTPPDAEQVDTKAYAWLTIDHIERERGGTPPPIPYTLQKEIMNGPLRPRSLAEQLQMGLNAPD